MFANGRTFARNIRSFPAGHYMESGKIHKYWELDMQAKKPPEDEELRELIKSSVHYRTISDVSVGSYLSGGLDSTIVAGLSEVDHTWTVGFPDFNEFKWSESAAKCFGSQHHSVIIKPDEFIPLAKEMIQRRKEPIAVPNEVLLYKMTQEVKRQNTVVLSGEGADELFFGYDRIFKWAGSASAWDIQEFSRLYAYGSSDDIEIVEDAISPYYKHGEPLNIVSAFFQTAHLEGLLHRLDSATMLCGVEARGPFLDYRLVDRLSGVAYNYKLENGVAKAPLKRIFCDLVPENIRKREKMGFPVRLVDVLPESIPGETFLDKWFEFNISSLMEVL
jgi:asparagine synthase (glutamine-hydrolysing)